MTWPGAARHVGSTAQPHVVRAVLGEAAEALREGAVPFVLVGGMASSLLGRRRSSSDVDLMVMPEHARCALGLLAQAGFATEETNPHWLFKALRREVLVDILFKSKGDVYLDREMLRRAIPCKVDGLAALEIPVVAREDLLVMKALAHDEETPRHWFDALGLLTESPLDWPYLLQRARKGPRRVLSLLCYATSLGLVVPDVVLRRLFDEITAGPGPR